MTRVKGEGATHAEVDAKKHDNHPLPDGHRPDPILRVVAQRQPSADFSRRC
jgi:hypothetical protein